ncbi:MAG: extracellular solute-binding protein [Erysipelotrichaceae bacterium]|nr:extracellular solute-binding protein [Erysipelotrichaceae bacterium]
MKKIILLLSALLLVASLSACTKKKTEVTLKVWGSQEDQVMLQEMVDAFIAANTDKIYTITLGVVGEPDAKTKYLEDPEAAADVFSFPNDQISGLVDAGALYEVTLNKAAIIAANVAGSIDVSTVGGKLYAYPVTADNGYFLYYDKSVFSADDVKSLDTMLTKAATANKKVFMDVSNGWYIASFFIGAGNTFKTVDGKKVIDFNNATGLKVGEFIKSFTANSAFVTGDDAYLKGNIGTTIAAGVSGTWNASDISTVLGANYAATKLPSYMLGTTSTQMGSFAGYKLMGVNALTKFPEEAMALAEFLTNEANQIKRFETRKLGPSNIKAATSTTVVADVALAALAAQAAFAISQNSVPDSYWGPGEAFGLAMETKDYSKTIQEMLDAWVLQANGS